MSTLINFDSSFKSTTAIINKAVKEVRNESKAGVVKKDLEYKQDTKKVEKDIQRDVFELFSINYFGLFFCLLVIAILILLYNRS